jgi:competence protein ComEC
MGKGVGLMLAIAQWVAGLPGATAMARVWPETALIAVVLGGLWILLWRRNWRWLGLGPISAGLLIAGLAKPPDILIARNGRDVAVRLANGKLALLHPARDRYAAASWLKRDGDVRMPGDAVASAKDGVRCDSDGCVARLPSGVLLAQSARFDALHEDCAEAQIVVSAVPTRFACRGPRLVIDRFDIARNGAYAIWLAHGTRIETVRQSRGHRPWSAQPAWRWHWFRPDHAN